MKNSNALGSRSWASRVMVVVLVSLAVGAVVAGVVPVSARIMIDDGGDGGGGGGSGSDDGGGGSCLDNVHGSLEASPDSLIAGQSTTLWWSSNAGTCATLKLVTASRREWPLNGSTGQVTNVPIFSSDGTEGYTLVAYRSLMSKPLANVTVQVQLPPTVTITSDNQVGVFLHAIATPWQRIEIQNHVNLDLSYEDNLYIAPGVKIIGGRSPTEPGPRLFTTTFPKGLFNIGSPYELPDSNANGVLDENAADNVRISGIRLQGPEMGIADEDAWSAAGITVYSSVGVEIDNNELSGWSTVAVDVRDPFDRLNQSGNNWNPYNWVWVHDNYIHHNQRNRTDGYGVSVHESGYALIEQNVFDYNRHAIAAEGKSLTGYRAHGNLVFGNGGLNNDTLNINTHQFDVHGSESCCGGYELYCGDAGEYFEFMYNTILYDHGTAIKVRGKPAVGALARKNVFKHPDQWGGCLNDAAMVQTDPKENFDAYDNTFGADFDDMVVHSVCDFNGDGVDDDFLATGASWWYRPGSGTNRVWRHLKTDYNTKHLDQLTLSYVSGDGVCDVTDDQGTVWLGGVTPSSGGGGGGGGGGPLPPPCPDGQHCCAPNPEGGCDLCISNNYQCQ